MPSPPAPALSVGRGLFLYLLLGLGWALLGSTGSVDAVSRDWESVTFVVLSALMLALLWLPQARRARRAHAQLGDTASHYRQMFDRNAGLMLVYDLESLQILDANPAAVEFFGWSHAEFVSLTVDALWPDGLDEKLEQAIARIRVDPNRYCAITDQLVLKDGSRRLMEVRGNSITHRGRTARLVIATDRSPEMQARERKQQALARLQEAHDIARIGAWELDPDTGLGLFSDQAYRLLGRRPPSQPRWRRVEDLLAGIDPDAGAHTARLIADLCAGRSRQIDVLIPLMSMDGRALTIHLRTQNNAGTAEIPRILHGTLQDVTEREQARRLLSEREEQFGELVRVLPDAVLILAAGQVLYVNSAGAAQFAGSSENLLGETLENLVDSADLSRVRDYLLIPQRYRSTLATLAPRMRRRDGSRFRASLAVGDVRYGGRDCKLLVIRDLTQSERDRHALEVSNRELQAMAGRLFSLQEDERRAISRDLHDDIGQAITAMKLSAHAALDESDPQRRREDLQQITGLADVTVVKLRNLSMLLRPPQLDALGLEAALRWQAGMLFRSSPVELAAAVNALPQRPSGEIEQACFRIAQESLTNALRHANASQVRLLLDDQEGRFLRLQVIDDGEGFDLRGPRGLGLIVMRERAQTAGGTVEIHSAPGAGTHIDLRLPYRNVAHDTPAMAGH
ncbi:PAS domain S-box protein [Stenotrophomonas sp. YIM B06876]|uniref:sensor histidine kinase n=1 Tax=Stenotrophomonas sp. YIM B06876 TaxID=3060211 RepID=UPI002739DD1D|nr:PAS domain S-box protein [Stenotrophomonas sp. YIM B06876]